MADIKNEIKAAAQLLESIRQEQIQRGILLNALSQENKKNRAKLMMAAAKLKLIKKHRLKYSV